MKNGEEQSFLLVRMSRPTASGKPLCDDDLPQKRSWPMDEDIVITGISGRYPECSNIDEFWEKLLAGVELMTSDDRRWPVGEF